MSKVYNHTHVPYVPQQISKISHMLFSSTQAAHEYWNTYTVNTYCMSGSSYFKVITDK